MKDCYTHFKQDIWDEENEQSDIVLRASKFQLLLEALDLCVSNIDAIEEGEHVQEE